MNGFEIVGYIITIILLCLFELLLGTWLWGVIAVGIFGLPALTWAQFLGLQILLNILLPNNSLKSISKEKD